MSLRHGVHLRAEDARAARLTGLAGIADLVSAAGTLREGSIGLVAALTVHRLILLYEQQQRKCCERVAEVGHGMPLQATALSASAILFASGIFDLPVVC